MRLAENVSLRRQAVLAQIGEGPWHEGSRGRWAAEHIIPSILKPAIRRGSRPNAWYLDNPSESPDDGPDDRRMDDCDTQEDG